MSDDRTYTQEVEHFSGIVEELTNELRAFKSEIRDDLRKMSAQIDKNTMDADNLTKGNSRHGIEPVRQIAQEAKREAGKANNRLDRIKWIVTGAAMGGGLGGGVIVKIIESFL